MWLSGPDVDLQEIGSDPRCDGFSGADMSALVREASMSALKEALKSSVKTPISVCRTHFDRAFYNLKPSVGEKDQIKYRAMQKKFCHKLGFQSEPTPEIDLTPSNTFAELEIPVLQAVAQGVDLTVEERKDEKLCTIKEQEIKAMIMDEVSNTGLNLFSTNNSCKGQNNHVEPNTNQTTCEDDVEMLDDGLEMIVDEMLEDQGVNKALDNLQTSDDLLATEKINIDSDIIVESDKTIFPTKEVCDSSITILEELTDTSDSMIVKEHEREIGVNGIQELNENRNLEQSNERLEDQIHETRQQSDINETMGSEVKEIKEISTSEVTELQKAGAEISNKLGNTDIKDLVNDTSQNPKDVGLSALSSQDSEDVTESLNSKAFIEKIKETDSTEISENPKLSENLEISEESAKNADDSKESENQNYEEMSEPQIPEETAEGIDPKESAKTNENRKSAEIERRDSEDGPGKVKTDGCTLRFLPQMMIRYYFMIFLLLINNYSDIFSQGC